MPVLYLILNKIQLRKMQAEQSFFQMIKTKKIFFGLQVSLFTDNHPSYSISIQITDLFQGFLHLFYR